MRLWGPKNKKIKADGMSDCAKKCEIRMDEAKECVYDRQDCKNFVRKIECKVQISSFKVDSP